MNTQVATQSFTAPIPRTTTNNDDHFAMTPDDSQTSRILRREWQRNKPHLPKSTSLPELQLAPAGRPLFTCQQCGFSNPYVPLCLWCSWTSKPAQQSFESSVPRARRASTPSNLIGSSLSSNDATGNPNSISILSSPEVRGASSSPQLPPQPYKAPPLPTTSRFKFASALGRTGAITAPLIEHSSSTTPKCRPGAFLSPSFVANCHPFATSKTLKSNRTGPAPDLDQGSKSPDFRAKAGIRVEQIYYDNEVTYKTVVGNFVVLDKRVALATSAETPRRTASGSPSLSFRSVKQVEGTWCNFISRTNFSPSRIRTRRATTSEVREPTSTSESPFPKSSTTLSSRTIQSPSPSPITVATKFATIHPGASTINQDTQSPRTITIAPSVHTMTNSATNHSRTQSSPAAVNLMDNVDQYDSSHFHSDELMRFSHDITTIKTSNLLPITPAKSLFGTDVPAKGLRRTKRTPLLRSSSPPASPVIFSTIPALAALCGLNDAPTTTGPARNQVTSSPLVPQAVLIPKAAPPPRPNSQPHPGRQNYAPHYLPLAFPNTSSESGLAITNPPKSQLLTQGPPDSAASPPPSRPVSRDGSPSPTPSVVRLGHPIRPLYTAIRKNMSRSSSPAPSVLSAAQPTELASTAVSSTCTGPCEHVLSSQVTVGNTSATVNVAAISAQSLAPTLISASSRPTSNLTMPYNGSNGSHITHSNSAILQAPQSASPAPAQATPASLNNIFCLNDERDPEDSITLEEDASVDTDMDDEEMDEIQLENLHRTLKMGILKESAQPNVNGVRRANPINSGASTTHGLFASGKAKVMKKVKDVMDKGDMGFAGESESDPQRGRVRTRCHEIFKGHDVAATATKKTIRVDATTKEKKENAYRHSTENHQPRKSKDSALPSPREPSKSFALGTAPAFKRMNGTGSLRIPSVREQVTREQEVGFGTIGHGFGCSVSGETELKLALARRSAEEPRVTDSVPSLFGPPTPDRHAMHHRRGSESDGRLKFTNLRRDRASLSLDTDDDLNSDAPVGNRALVAGKVRMFKNGVEGVGVEESPMNNITKKYYGLEVCASIFSLLLYP